jgi:hypothetical protein
VQVIDGQRLRERVDQLAAQLGGGTRLRRGGRDAVQRGRGAVGARS